MEVNKEIINIFFLLLRVYIIVVLRYLLLEFINSRLRVMEWNDEWLW